MARIGPLLRNVLGRLESAQPAMRAHEMAVVTTQVGGTEEGGTLPLVLQLGRERPETGETWPEYKERIGHRLGMMGDVVFGGDAQPLYLANALAGQFPAERIVGLADRREIDMIELDPVVHPILMDDAVVDVGLETFRFSHGPLRGEGVRVAVLDSGIDLAHPYLNVSASASTCGEDAALPGAHGTHCAGSVASRDPIFPGVAPDATLLNIKVLRQNGSGRHTYVTAGVDSALDLEADILSMSLGFNHLPTWSHNGHGWSCSDGRCPLCMAVDNATRFGAVVCVAAGNEHERAETLRRFGYGNSFDTELCCPGQARTAITVGAITKRSFLSAEFSSRGPSAFGRQKPDLVGPGVNVTSTVPVPRLADGNLVANPLRADLFDRESGTSMATPIVAGAAALMIEHRRASGLSVSPRAIRKALLSETITPLTLPANVVGHGRIDLGQLGVMLTS